VATKALVLSIVAVLTCVTIVVPVVAIVVARGARRGRLRLASAALGIAIVALVLGVAIDANLAIGALKDSEEGVEYTELRPGDCFERPGERFVRAVRQDCNRPHDLEVFATVDDPAPPGAPYPGQEILEREAAVACLPQFEAYVGVPFDQSELVFTRYVPTERSWRDDDRLLLCTLSAKEGQLQGPAKGSRR
jgi:hypothetical protein